LISAQLIIVSSYICFCSYICFWFFFFFLIIMIIFKNQGWYNNETMVSNDDLMERGLQYRDLQSLDVFGIQRDVQRDWNAETWHIVRQCEQILSHVTATCEVFARAICNHGFSISQLHGDRDSANCLALPFEFPLVVDYERFVDRVSASRVSVCESENRS